MVATASGSRRPGSCWGTRLPAVPGRMGGAPAGRRRRPGGRAAGRRRRPGGPGAAAGPGGRRSCCPPSASSPGPSGWPSRPSTLGSTSRASGTPSGPGSSATCTTALGPALAGMSMRVQATLRDDPSPEYAALLADLADGLAASRTDLRRIVAGLTPSALDDGDLGPALRAWSRRSGGQHEGPRVSLETALGACALCLRRLQVAVYRCVAEGVTNALRHASASAIDVSVRRATRRAARRRRGRRRRRRASSSRASVCRRWPPGPRPWAAGSR